MVDAAIASGNPETAGQLRAGLQQSGLVRAITEWSPSPEGEWAIDPRKEVPEVVILDIDHEPSAFFSLAAQLRRLRPAVRMVAYSAQPPVPEILLDAMRSGVQEFLIFPVDVTELRSTLQRFVAEVDGHGLIPARKLTVVIGAKGGVGTSTLSVNLAVQIAALTRKRTILLDLGAPVGHDALLLDLRPRFTIRDAIESLDVLDSLFLSGLLTKHSSGLELLAGINHAEEWPRVSAKAVGRILNVAQSIADFVVMDFGTCSSPDWKDLLSQSRTILLVAETNVPSLWSLERQISALADLDRETGRVRIVINRWDRKDEQALKSVEKNLKRSVFARLTNDFGQVSEAVNLGVPLSKNHNNPLLHQVRQLATRIVGEAAVAEPQRSSLSQLFSFGK